MLSFKPKLNNIEKFKVLVSVSALILIGINIGIDCNLQQEQVICSSIIRVSQEPDTKPDILRYCCHTQLLLAVSNHIVVYVANRLKEIVALKKLQGHFQNCLHCNALYDLNFDLIYEMSFSSVP